MRGGDTPPRRTKRQGLAACPEGGINTAEPNRAEARRRDSDCFDIRQTEIQERNLSPTLIATDYKGGKAICFENHAQDARMKEVDISQTISARMGTGGNNLPLVMNDENPSETPTRNQGGEERRKDGEEPGTNRMAEIHPQDETVVAFIKNDAGGVQQGFWDNVFPTVRSQVIPAVAHRECFNVTFCDANGTRKDRKKGGLYVTEADAGKTVTTNGPNAETVVIDPPEIPIALDGDKMAKAERKGGSGLGISEEGVMYTQTVKDVHGVAYNECVPLDLRNATRDPEKHDGTNRQGVGVGVDGDPMNTVSASNVPGVGWQATVRRLLPDECERLMGFSDNHTRIPWKGKPEEECPDAPRYKACGNSMCVNVMSWIGMRIDMVEKVAFAEATSQQPGENE